MSWELSIKQTSSKVAGIFPEKNSNLLCLHTPVFKTDAGNHTGVNRALQIERTLSSMMMNGGATLTQFHRPS